MEYLPYVAYGWSLISAVVLMFQRDRNEKQNEKLRNQISHLRGGVTIENKAKRKKLQSEKDMYIEQLKQSLKEAHKDVGALKVDLEKRTKKVESLNGWIEGIKPDYRTQKEQLTKEQRSRQKLQERCEDQKQEIYLLKEVNADLGEQMRGLQEDSKKLAGINKEELEELKEEHSRQIATLNGIVENAGLHAQELEQKGRAEVEGLKDQLDVLAKLNEKMSAEATERSQELATTNAYSQQLSTQLTALEESKQRDVNSKLLQMVQRTALAQRYINEMYRRGEIELEVRQSAIYKTEILQEIENKIITEKNAQILTREGRLQLSTNSSLLEITRSQHDLAVQIDRFTMDKREYTFTVMIEQERWELKHKLDVFDIDKRKHSLEVLAERTTDERRKVELLNIADTLDLERTRQGLQVFSDSLDSQVERMELQKLLNDFDNTKELHKLKIFSDSLSDRERKAELDILISKLDTDKTKFSLERYKTKLENEKERHDIQVIIDTFDLEKGKTALIQAKERFLIRIEKEVNDLQAKLDKFVNDQAKHELQKQLNNFNLEVREKRRELDDLKHDLLHDIKSHELQIKLDDFNLARL